jgi:hypothetical protein
MAYRFEFKKIFLVICEFSVNVDGLCIYPTSVNLTFNF